MKKPACAPMAQKLLQTITDHAGCGPVTVGAILTAIDYAGYVIVPKEPTKEMCLVGETAVDNNIDSTSDSYCTYDVYNEMTLATEAYRAMVELWFSTPV